MRILKEGDQIIVYPTNEMSDLCKIASRFKTDKCCTSKWHSYTEVYDLMLSRGRASCKNVLEIGIGNADCMGVGYQMGSSLLMWREYFPSARITGIDIDPKTMMENTDRISTYLCDQADELALSERFAGSSFDLIIDDASHMPSDQIPCFRALWRYVKPGGYYFIEDVMTKKIDETMAGIRQELNEMPLDKRPTCTLIRVRNGAYDNTHDDNMILVRDETQPWQMQNSL